MKNAAQKIQFADEMRYGDQGYNTVQAAQSGVAGTQQDLATHRQRVDSGDDMENRKSKGRPNAFRLTTIVLGVTCIVLQALYMSGIFGGKESKSNSPTQSSAYTLKFSGAREQPRDDIVLVSEAQKDPKKRNQQKSNRSNVSEESQADFARNSPYPAGFDGGKLGQSLDALKDMYPNGRFREGDALSGATFSVELNGPVYRRVVYFLDRKVSSGGYSIGHITFWINDSKTTQSVVRAATFKLGPGDMEQTPAGRRFLWKLANEIVEINEDKLTILGSTR